jgi:hypothetical protein
MSAPFWLNVYEDREGQYVARLSDPSPLAAELAASLTERLANVRCIYRLKVTPKARREAA